jgi:UPF0176 protein
MTPSKSKFRLITFYKFIDVPEPKKEVAEMKRFLEDIGMKGRIYIGEEGINTQASCNEGQYKAFLMYLNSHPLFNNIPDIEAKATIVDGHKFPKMIVRYRKEIVALGVVYKANDIEEARYKKKVEQFKEMLDNESPDNYLILDMRNDYEYRLGHFKNAHPAGTMTFKETEQWIDEYKKRGGNKEVIMYCTGGIRCEKLAVMLQESGMEGVKQLDGGVVKYVNSFNDGNWLGNLYTFDDRVSTPVGDNKTHQIIAKCHYSDEPTEEMHNCRHGKCNKQIIAKPREYKKHMGFCSEKCYHDAIDNLNIRDVDFDPLDYKTMRWEIKMEKRTKEEVQRYVAEHLKYELRNIEFKHKEPVEERLSVDDYLE